MNAAPPRHIWLIYCERINDMHYMITWDGSDDTLRDFPRLLLAQFEDVVYVPAIDAYIVTEPFMRHFAALFSNAREWF